MAINKIKILNLNAIPVHDERWLEESSTIMTTPSSLRIGYDYNEGDNVGGGKVYFGDSGNVYVGEKGFVGDDSDSLQMYASETVEISGNEIDIDAHDGDYTGVYINGNEVKSGAFRDAGMANGVATLDSAGKVPSSQLPSYVDDVLEYSVKSSFPTTGETGKIYIDVATNTSWRWSGSTYVQIKGDLAIGTVTGTAADGGVVNSHINNTSNPHNVTKAQLGLGNVENKSASTILSGLTSANVTTALGYTPAKSSDIDRDNTVKSGDYILGLTTYAPNSGVYKRRLNIDKIDDALYAADKRWYVTHKVYDSETGEFKRDLDNGLLIFSGNTEIPSNWVAEGEYAELYIGAYPEGTEDDGSGGPHMFSYGEQARLFFNFYYGREPGNILARYYSKYHHGWYDATVTKLVSSGLAWEAKIGAYGTYLSAIKITYTGTGSFDGINDLTKPTSLSTLTCLLERNSYLTQNCNVNKYAIDLDLYGTVIAPKFKVRGGSSSQFLKADGTLDSNTYVTTSQLNSKQNALTFDSTPTSGSSNPVTSGGVKTALDLKLNNLTFDSNPTTGSTNPVTSNGINLRLGGLTFVALTLDEYNSLSTVSSSTVYIING